MVFYWLEALLLGVTLVALGAIVKLCRDVKKALGRFDRQLPSCPSQDVKFSSSRTRRVFKEPSVFDGNQATFKEWTFAMELALRSLAFADPTEDVDYAIGYLSGNARLWVISALYYYYYYYYIFIFIQGHPYRPIGLLTGCPNQVLN